MIEWEAVRPRAADRSQITLTVFSPRAGARLNARICFPDSSAHPFSGPFEAPCAVAVSRSKDGRHFLVQAGEGGPFRVARVGIARALCVVIPWLWPDPGARLILTAEEAASPGRVQYAAREAPDDASRAKKAAGGPAAQAANAAKVVGSVSSLPAAPVCAPETPVVASREAISTWASQRGLPHSPFVLEQVNRKRRALGLPPFAVAERAWR